MSWSSNYHSLKLAKKTIDKINVREVWENNLEAEIELIRKISSTYTILAIDTEFPGTIIKTKDCILGERHYSWIKDNIDLLKLIQLGLTFCKENGELPLINGVPSIWQFNFQGFKLDKDPCAKESIRLLAQSGIDFEAHEYKGIDLQQFGELLINSGIIFSPKIKWVTFQGLFDFGYLLKVCTKLTLPETAREYFVKLKQFFPSAYDVKYLLKFCNLDGGLNRLANYLQVKRSCYEHQAGPDSLNTARIYVKLVNTYFCGYDVLNKFNGYI